MLLLKHTFCQDEVDFKLHLTIHEHTVKLRQLNSFVSYQSVLVNFNFEGAVINYSLERVVVVDLFGGSLDLFLLSYLGIKKGFLLGLIKVLLLNVGFDKKEGFN